MVSMRQVSVPTAQAPQREVEAAGRWQRLFLVELFEPRRRTVDVAILGEEDPA